MQASEDAGLVHKSFHNKQDIQKDEFAICNCCRCCCGTFELYYRGAAPTHTFASHIAEADLDACEECGLCEDQCPMEAITLKDEKPDIDENRCIGCGVCAYHCPAEAIALRRTGQREVFVPPPLIAAAETMTSRQ